jgi:hypothetical protein
MQTKLLVPVLAAGLALSASVFGQNASADVGWTRSTAADSMTGANTYSPNTYRAEKTQAREQKKFQQQQQFEGGSYWAQLAKMNLPNSSQTKAPAANWKAEEGD